jgi:citrate lyase subunit beta/citryl-CoA lyase
MTMRYFSSVGSVASRQPRLRRSCLAVPGSNPRMMQRAAERGADQIFLDLEDAVAPNEKKRARAMVVEALNTHDYGATVVTVRVNDATTPYMYGDIIELMQGAGGAFDCVMVPKVVDAGQLWFVEHLMNQLEADLELDRRHGCEVQIETGTGSVNMTEIARVSDRTECLIFGPGDYAADMGIPQLDVGAVEPAYPGYQWAYINAQIVNTARSVGIDAIDGPYSDYRDAEGFREMAMRAKLLGMDGKWCIHPSQIELANEVFTPTKDQFAYATGVLEAYRDAVEAGKGAATYEGKMIDEASRKMAEKLVARGRAAGMGA